MISICIPVYEMNGVGAKMLAVLLNTIRMQKCFYKFEVVVSDNSKTDELENICKYFGSHFDLKHFYSSKIGASVNINNAISLANYEIVKPMMQDDAFTTPNSLNHFVEALDKAGWCISNSLRINGQGDVKSRQMAVYNHKQFDRNTTGMPSVIAFKKCDLRFREDLHTTQDMLFYYQLYELYGAPAVIKEYSIAQRFHGDSLSHHQKSKHKEEHQMLRRMKIITV